jgi:hypothetical protein
LGTADVVTRAERHQLDAVVGIQGVTP